MNKGDDIIKEIHDLLDSRVDGFMESIPKVQRQAYEEVLILAKELDTNKDGTIKPTLKNVKMIAKIKQRLNEVIIDGRYMKELQRVVDTYEKIAVLQNSYFTAMVGQFGIPSVLAEIQRQSIEITVESLGKNGLNAGVINKVRDILNKNVTTGGKISSFMEEVRLYLLDSPDGDGALKKYTGQIVTDALNQYSRQYNQILTDDLGFKFFRYSGSLRKTSREFCIKLIDARKTGCLEFIHVSQFKQLLEGRICGDQIPIYKKYDLPHGMIKGTNISSLQVNAGGYNCNHGFYGVPKAIVPKAIWDQYEN